MVKAIKMQSEDGEMLCTEHWCAQSGGRWHTQEIPNGLEIIGIQVFTESRFIPGLVFLLWDFDSRKMMDRGRQARSELSSDSESSLS